MNVLILNAFGNHKKGIAKFEQFSKLVQQIFKKVSYKSGVGEIQFYCKNIEDIDDYLFPFEHNKPESEKFNPNNKKNFDKIDFVFVDGREKALPWLDNGVKLREFLKLCKRTNKIIFAGGVAMEHLIYFFGMNYRTGVNFINSGGEIQAIEDIHQIQDSVLFKIKKNDFFLDYVTGDVYEYSSDSHAWFAIMNIGLHKIKLAEKYIDRGRSVLNLGGSSYRPKSVAHRANQNGEPVTGINNEIKIYIKKQYSSHWLIKDIPSEFVVFSTLSWFVHNFCMASKYLQFKTICESQKGPMVIEHENSVGTAFHIVKQYPHSVTLMYNFIKRKFNEYKERCFGIRCYELSEFEKKLKRDEDIPVIFKQYMHTDAETEEAGAESIQEQTYLHDSQLLSSHLVNSSRPFSSIKKVRSVASHVGMSFNNREMIFVENNAVDQRPISSKQRVKSALQLKESCSDKNKKESSVKSKHEESCKKDEDYFGAFSTQQMDEEKIIEYYKKKTREICEKLVQETKDVENKSLKLGDSNFCPNSNLNLNLNSIASKKNIRLLTAKTRSNSSQLFRRTSASLSKNRESDESKPTKIENESVFSQLFPYVPEEEFQKPVIRDHLKALNDGKEGKEVVRLNQFHKTGNNYNSKFKLYEKELNSFAMKPLVALSSEYVTEEELRKKEFFESKKKWMSKEDFKRVFGKNTTKLEVIPPITSIGSQQCALTHRYREVDKTKWIGGKNFKL